MNDVSPTILLVEDQEDIADQLQEELEREGFNVISTRNGVEAMHSLEKGTPPHVILLDLLLPVMDGWQFLKARATRAAWAKIPVIALSAVAYRGAPGAAAVLSKPVDLDVLLRTIERYSPRPVTSSAS